jgi:hypothetical protein
VWSSRGEEEARDEREDDVVMMEVRDGGEVGRRDEEGIDEAVAANFPIEMWLVNRGLSKRRRGSSSLFLRSSSVRSANVATCVDLRLQLKNKKRNW